MALSFTEGLKSVFQYVSEKRNQKKTSSESGVSDAETHQGPKNTAEAQLEGALARVKSQEVFKKAQELAKEKLPQLEDGDFTPTFEEYQNGIHHKQKLQEFREKFISEAVPSTENDEFPEERKKIREIFGLTVFDTHPTISYFTEKYDRETFQRDENVRFMLPSGREISVKPETIAEIQQMKTRLDEMYDKVSALPVLRSNGNTEKLIQIVIQSKQDRANSEIHSWLVNAINRAKKDWETTNYYNPDDLAKMKKKIDGVNLLVQSVAPHGYLDIQFGREYSTLLPASLIDMRNILGLAPEEIFRGEFGKSIGSSHLKQETRTFYQIKSEQTTTGNHDVQLSLGLEPRMGGHARADQANELFFKLKVNDIQNS